MAKDNQHAAHASATGYLYQARLALLLGIRAIKATPDLELRIETFDDISFESEGDPVELIQTKHHTGASGSLTDASSDLWKTLRIWAQLAKSTLDTLPRFVLLTTGYAPEGSVASLLRPTSRNEKDARKRLDEVALTSSNKDNKSAYEAYEALNASQRLRLLQSITVLDGAFNILDVAEEIAQELRLAAPRQHVPHLVERLEGWWFGLVVVALSNGGSAIKVLAIDQRLDELREEFHRLSLPVDHANAEPSPDVIAALDRRPFVQQLRKVGIGAARIEYAMRDYYRASEQRARWVREELLIDGELREYERELTEGWQPRFATMADELPVGCDAATKAAAGAQIYKWVEQEALTPFRTVSQAFLTKGSYHILANRYEVGWHPDFKLDVSTDGGE